MGLYEDITKLIEDTKQYATVRIPISISPRAYNRLKGLADHYMPELWQPTGVPRPSLQDTDKAGMLAAAIVQMFLDRDPDDVVVMFNGKTNQARFTTVPVGKSVDE